MHPGIAAEFGYDSNYYQRADSAIEELNYGPVVDAWRLRITPTFVMRTVDKRIEQGPGGATGALPVLKLELAANASGNLLFGDDNIDEERNIQGGVGAGLVLLPGRPWSFDLDGGYTRTVEPSNLPGFVNSYNRDTVNAGAGVTWSPGGGLFEWRIVGYDMRATLFEEDLFTSFNNLDHRIDTRGRWKFFPRSAVLFDGQYRMVRYTNTTGQNNGDLIRARLGYNGLLTNRLGLLAIGGWAASFYEDTIRPSKDYDDFVVQAELKWFLTAQSTLQPSSANVGLSTIAVGFDRSFNNSYLGNFYRSNRGYAQLSYFFGGRVVTTLEAGFAEISYPDFSVAGTGPGDRFPQPGFSENRIDAKLFTEYRPMDSVGVNVTLQYNQNMSKVIPLSETDPLIRDDLDFTRWQAFLGVRWFL